MAKKKSKKPKQNAIKETGSIIDNGKDGNIAKPKQVEAVLQESEANWRSITDNSPDYILTVDNNLNIQFANRAAQMSSVDDLIGTQITTFVGEEKRLEVKPILEKVLKTGEPDRYETEYATPDGRTVYFEIDAAARIQADNVIGLTIIARDITDRKNAEEALRESTENLIKAQHIAHLGSWNWDMETDQVAWSDEMYRIHGIDPDKLHDALNVKVALDMVHPDDFDRVQENIQHGLQEGKPIPIEYRIVLPNGNMQTVHAEGDLMFDESGKPIRMIGTVQNITEFKRVEEALRASEEKWRQLVDYAPERITILDRDGTILYINRASPGRTVNETIGASAHKYLSPDEKRKLNQALQEVFKSGRTVNYEAIIVRDDGTKVWYRNSYAPYKLDGRVVSAMVISTDITESKLMEKALQETNRRLEETVTKLNAAQKKIIQQERLSAVGQLATGIAHDFNNILVPITLYTEALLNEPGLATHDEERLRTILKQAFRAASFIEQILDFSRQSVLEVRNLELVGLLREFKKLIARTLPENITIELIEDSEKYVIQADSTRMQQMLLNLALNARDAMPDGGQLRIEISPLQIGRKDAPPFMDMPPGEWLQLEVIDTGEGIQAEDLPHIFEPFFTTKEVGEGVGLGLAQVYGIVKQHGGYIDVKSEVGEGTTCIIYLPLVSAEPEVDSKEIAAMQVQGKGETILVVEDDEFVQQALGDILEMLGYRVLTTTRSLEALEIFERETIDLVLSDLVMPDMGGVQLYKSLRERDPDVKMVVITGYPIEDEGGVLLEQGILARIQKPPNIKVISEVIHSALEVKENQSAS